MDHFLPVSRAFLPPMEEIRIYLESIYRSGTVTNNGPLLRSFEDHLRDLLGVKHVFVVANGTWALQLAYRAMGLRNQVITTAFSAIPTLSSLQWEYLEPVFADIDPGSFNLSPASVEAVFQPGCEAILATHVFGTSCNIPALREVADRLNLKLIFDGAHAMGTSWEGKSVFQYGDVSILSLHAFKVLNCIEGGAILTNHDHIAENLYRMRYFGLNAQMETETIGTNAKNSEWHAAVGLANLQHLPELLRQRKEQYFDYLELLRPFPLQFQTIDSQGTSNYSYFPVVLPDEPSLLRLADELAHQGIQTKRYFHPSLNRLATVAPGCSMPVSESVASRILCLPHHHEVTAAHRRSISNCFAKVLES